MKAAARTDELRLEPLRPTAETSAEIRAAFYRVRTAHDENEAAIAMLTADRTRVVATGTTTQINEVDDRIRHRRAFAEQIGLLEADLRERFTRAKESEEDEEYAKRLRDMKAIESSWNEDFRTRYPALAAEIVHLLQRELAILAGYSDLAHLPGASRALLAPETLALTASMQSAFLSSHPHFGVPMTFATSIVLPNLRPGAPLWLGKRWKL